MKNIEKNAIRGGIYPTMVFPYTRDNRIDEAALRGLVRWYGKKGCHGIFAGCYSSETFFLSFQERRRMVEIVKEEALAIAEESGGEPMSVVSSNHISDSLEEQAEELLMTWEAGADAVVFITNRFDIANTGDMAWIRDFEKLLGKLPGDLPIGGYECPYPYKRLLTGDMLRALRDTGRCVFIKDTCCDPDVLKERLEILKGSNVGLFNANAQTLLYSLRLGAKGFNGLMANFHPEFYVWLYENYQECSGEAERLQNELSMAAFTEVLAYPLTAKHYLREYEGIPMEVFSRIPNLRQMGSYDRFVMKQLYQLNQAMGQRFLRM